MEHIAPQLDYNKQRIEYAMSCNFLLIVLGYEWCKANVLLVRHHPNGWMLNGDDSWMLEHPIEDDTRRVMHYARVITLADAFFTFLNRGVGKETTEDFRRRIFQQDTKAAYLEVLVAALLSRNGFSVKARRETGVKGQDFDIDAFIGGQSIAVEVTAKADGPFGANSVKNTLKQKRLQLPKDRPNYIYMYTPFDWWSDVDNDFLSNFEKAIQPVYKNSSRINAIIFLWERYVSIAEGAIPQFFIRPCYNLKARNRFLSEHLLTWESSARGAMFDRFINFLEEHQAKRSGYAVSD